MARKELMGGCDCGRTHLALFLSDVHVPCRELHGSPPCGVSCCFSRMYGVHAWAPYRQKRRHTIWNAGARSCCEISLTLQHLATEASHGSQVWRVQVRRVRGWWQVSPVVQVSDSGQGETGPKGTLGPLCVKEHYRASRDWVGGVQVRSWRGGLTRAGQFLETGWPQTHPHRWGLGQQFAPWSQVHTLGS